MSVREIPDGGICLSSFLVISDKQVRNRILFGRLNPAAPWDHIGALDPPRVTVHSKGWMLPSSHMMIRESPQEAAARILKEQLGLDGKVDLSEPKVVSEVYTPKRFPGLASHWDLEFIFQGELDSKLLRQNKAWISLEFISVDRLKRSEISRSHEDILKHVGLFMA